MNALGEKQQGSYGEHRYGQHFASDAWDTASQELKSTVRAHNKAVKKRERMNKKSTSPEHLSRRIDNTLDAIERLSKKEGVAIRNNWKRMRDEM